MNTYIYALILNLLLFVWPITALKPIPKEIWLEIIKHIPNKNRFQSYISLIGVNKTLHALLLGKNPVQFLTFYSQCISEDSPEFSLIHASLRNHPLAVKKLLTCKGIDINYEASPMGTALCCAAYWGHYSIAKLLLKHKAKIDLGMRTPLYQAAQNGRLAIVELLLCHGASPFKTTLFGTTPLEIAAKHNQVQVVKYLLQNIRYSFNELHRACKASLLKAKNKSLAKLISKYKYRDLRI